MFLDQEILVNCSNTNVDARGKIIRIYKNGFDVSILDSIIKMKLKKDNLFVGNLHGLEFTCFVSQK